METFTAKQIGQRIALLKLYGGGSPETAAMMQYLLDANLLLIKRCEALRAEITRLHTDHALSRDLHRELSEP
jgi:hypothetical protein